MSYCILGLSVLKYTLVIIMADRICVSVLLPPEQYEQLKKLANSTGRSMSGYLRRLVTLYLIEIKKYPEKQIT